MIYEKPEILEVGNAVEAVQGSTLKNQNPVDIHAESTSAYQSDED